MIHLMEWKAVLSRNAFLLSKFLICMQSLFRICRSLDRVTYRDTTATVYRENEKERKEKRGNRERDMCHLAVMHKLARDI